MAATRRKHRGELPERATCQCAPPVEETTRGTSTCPVCDAWHRGWVVLTNGKRLSKLAWLCLYEQSGQGKD